MYRKRSIALVVPAFSLGGGVPAMAIFLYHVIAKSDRYTPEIVSLALAARDQNSIRLLRPASWTTDVRVTTEEWQGLPHRHVGAVLAEFEFQRYRPRRVLTELLSPYDLIQVVAGTPAWALTTANVGAPVCLFTATRVQQERAALYRQLTGWRKYWVPLMTWCGTWLERRALARMACVFGESNYTLRLLAGRVPPAKLLLGAPGVDTNLFRPAPVYNKNGFILSVGRFSDRRKNARLLIEAYHHLRQAYPQAPRLRLVGSSGPSHQDLAYAASLGLSSQIEVCEGVSNEHLAALYRDASLFVLASDEEGMGIVILEAMASGLPVVSTDCGGPSTAIVAGETGLLTPVGDAPALARAMHILLDDPTIRQRMGLAGQQRVEARFSLQAAGQVYLDKYDELLAGEAA